MLKFATTQKKHPVGIRIPAVFSDITDIDDTDYSKLENKVVLAGEKIAIFAVGKMIDMAIDIAKRLKQDKNLNITVINPLVLSSLDEKLLNNLKDKHDLVITLEDGELMGGYGQNIASYYGLDEMLVKCYGISKEFHTDFKPDELLAKNGMSVENICDNIYNFLNI